MKKKQKEEWNGLCSAGKHGVDYKGAVCDLCFLEKKPEWKQERSSTYSLAITPQIPLLVHHYAGCGDTWFVSCYALSIETVQLKSTDPEQAKIEALAFVKSYVDRISKGLERIVRP